jgi:hypothetical protein
LTYEFSDGNIGFELDELFETGENVSVSFAEAIELACKYVTCSRHRGIARATQLLQEQISRDFQVQARRLRQRLEGKKKTSEFRDDETLFNLIASLQQTEAVLDEDGQVKWAI